MVMRVRVVLQSGSSFTKGEKQGGMVHRRLGRRGGAGIFHTEVKSSGERLILSRSSEQVGTISLDMNNIMDMISELSEVIRGPLQEPLEFPNPPGMQLKSPAS